MLLTAVLAGLAVAVAIGVPGPGRLVSVLPRRAAGPGWPRAPGSPVGDPGSLRPVASRVPALGRQLGPVLVGLVALVPIGPVGAVVAAGLTLAGRRAVRHRREATAREAERTGAVEACAVLASELKAGRGPADALAAAATVAAGPVGAALVTAATGARFGGDVPGVLTRAAGSSATPDLLGGLAACWLVCSATGTGLATAVDRLSEGLRAQHAQRREVDAELAGPKASAALLALLPVVGTAMAAGLGARPLQVLFHTTFGAVCLLLGVGLDLLGLWWTGRLVAAAGGAR